MEAYETADYFSIQIQKFIFLKEEKSERLIYLDVNLFIVFLLFAFLCSFTSKNKKGEELY